MRIKRFIASDMRTALRMVREEQGPDAVILSNRPTADGIEIVSATDYDEALVQQALQAAAPGIEPAARAARSVVADRTATRDTAASSAMAEAMAAASRSAAPPRAAEASATAAPAPSVRETLATRARAVFRIGDAPAEPVAENPEPTLAELTASTTESSTTPEWARSATRSAAASPSRFEAMMASLAEPAIVDRVVAAAQQNAASEAAAAIAAAGQVPAEAPALVQLAETADSDTPAPTPSPAAAAAPPPAPATASVPAPTVAETTEPEAPCTPILRAVPDPDPGILAMREELSSMRQLIEREMGQFAVERLRGSPARAAAYDALLGYGCDEQLAQQVAARIDPALPADKIRAPMLAELARLLTIIRSEPLDDGGVIALVGPTGAGKTTTVAKLAARFAARHRARDVALVTTDNERVGAREQLHAHGRKLGITVCEADGAQGLAQTLEQLKDYPLVLVDTAGYGARDHALLGQITWLRATEKLRSLLVLPANAHPHDMNEVIRRYRMVTPEGVVLTKLDETGRLGASLSVLVRNGLGLAYTTDGQQVPEDLDTADASDLVLRLEKLRRAADNPLATEDRHVVA